MDKLLEDSARVVADALVSRSTPDGVRAAERASTLLRLKLLDESEAVQGGGEGTADRPGLFDRQASRYRWGEWSGLPADALRRFLVEEVLPYMGSVVREAPAIADFFRDVDLSDIDAQALGQAVQAIDGLTLLSLEPESAGSFLEAILTRVGLHSSNGHYRTSTALRDLMAELVAPREGESVYDPALGTGGLLVAAARSAPAGLIDLAGTDISRAMLRIATTALAVRRLPTTGLRRQDALRELDDRSPDRRRFDVVLCDPPFGPHRSDGRAGAGPLGATRRTETLFAELAMDRLAPGGRAAVVVPDIVLFDGSAPGVAMRRRLVEEFHLRAVLGLAPGRLRAQRGLRTAVLVFGRPDGLAQQPRSVWFHQLGALGGRADRTGEDATGLPAFRAAWRKHQRAGFENPPGPEGETLLPHGSRPPSSWWVPIGRLAEAGYRLDLGRWTPFVEEEPAATDPAELASSAARDFRELSEGLALLARSLGS